MMVVAAVPPPAEAAVAARASVGEQSPSMTAAAGVSLT